MKRKSYNKPAVKKIRIDNQISFVMMTSETEPPYDPFSSIPSNKNNTQDPFKA